MKPSGVDNAATSPLDAAPMSGRQILILGAMVLLGALDGYDALSMAFVAPALGREWNLDKAVIGILLSSSFAGMALGSIFVSPLADKFGRRTVVLGGLILMTVGSFMSAYAPTVPLLAAARGLTGIGIGAMIVMTTLLSAEFSNVRRRAFAVAAVTTIGFPLGGVVGGLGAAVLLRTAGWEWVFLAGAIAGAALLVLLALCLPESPAYLIGRRPPNALQRLNQALARLGQPEAADLPPGPPRQQVSYKAVLAPGLGGITLRLTAVNLLFATSAYYVLNWLPQLVTDAGFPAATGSFVSAIAGMVGFCGGLTFGALATRVPPSRMVMVSMTGITLSLVAIALIPPILSFFMVVAGAFGLCLSGTTGLFYGIVASSFPPSLRASGVGMVLGIGRIASAMGPALAGWMFAQGLTRAEVSLTFAVGPVIAAMLIGTLPRTASRRTPSDPELVREA